MADTPKIAPVLTALEWEEALAWPHGLLDYLVKPGEAIGYGKDKPEDLRALIALANAALPDDDPRKITRTHVKGLRSAAIAYRSVAEALPEERRAQRSFTDGQARFFDELADALESYLPPES